MKSMQNIRDKVRKRINSRDWEVVYSSFLYLVLVLFSKNVYIFDPFFNMLLKCNKNVISVEFGAFLNKKSRAYLPNPLRCLSQLHMISSIHCCREEKQMPFTLQMLSQCFWLWILHLRLLLFFKWGLVMLPTLVLNLQAQVIFPPQSPGVYHSAQFSGTF
jgi:hypothetical protein